MTEAALATLLLRSALIFVVTASLVSLVGLILARPLLGGIVFAALLGALSLFFSPWVW